MTLHTYTHVSAHPDLGGCGGGCLSDPTHLHTCSAHPDLGGCGGGCLSDPLHTYTHVVLTLT